MYLKLFFTFLIISNLSSYATASEIKKAKLPHYKISTADKGFKVTFGPFSAETQDYSDAFDKENYIKKGGQRYMDTTITVGQYSNCINWFIDAPMDDTSQQFRDAPYQFAAEGHRFLDQGCASYYRGTNALHLLRQHADNEEGALNHNHYPLNGDLEVTPLQFEKHLRGFVRANHFRRNIELNMGLDKLDIDVPQQFITDQDIDEIALEYSKYYSEKHKLKFINTDLHHLDYTSKALELREMRRRLFTQEDLDELAQNSGLEKPCKNPELNIEAGIRGLRADRADQRQPHDIDPEVVRLRVEAQTRSQKRREMQITEYNKLIKNIDTLPISILNELERFQKEELERLSIKKRGLNDKKNETVKTESIDIIDQEINEILKNEDTILIEQSKLEKTLSEKEKKLELKFRFDPKSLSKDELITLGRSNVQKAVRLKRDYFKISNQIEPLTSMQQIELTILLNKKKDLKKMQARIIDQLSDYDLTCSVDKITSQFTPMDNGHCI